MQENQKEYINEQYDYAKLANSANLLPVEEDWAVVVADVTGSTKAVMDGRYRDVNLVGAACIAAIRNEFGGQTVPYVFGGDGATFLVEPSKLNCVLLLLNEVKELAIKHLNLTLRVGHILIKEVKELGGEVFYGQLPLTEYESFAYFRGNGIAIAERVIKERSAKITTTHTDCPNNKKRVNLSGLACRILPCDAQRGEVLSIIIEPQLYGKGQDNLLTDIFKSLQHTGKLHRLRPIYIDNLKRSALGDKWIAEAKLKSKKTSIFSIPLSLIKTFLEYLIVYFIFFFEVPLKEIGDHLAYNQAVILQSDWIKMDGALRLVIDVTKPEKRRLLRTLSKMQKANKIWYGCHSSTSAVIVCHYQSGVDNKHTHFVDGVGGGLTLAAFDLKQRKRAFL